MVIVLISCALSLAWCLFRWAATALFRIQIPASFAKRIDRLIMVVFLVGLPMYLVGSEYWYGNQIKPAGISEVSDYFRRFGEPRRIRTIESDETTFYHLHGHFPAWYVLALPSEPPVYVFDKAGRFVEWCRDPGDIASYWERWPREAGTDIDGKAFREQFDRRQ